MHTLDFSEALIALKCGDKISRRKWKAGVFVVAMPPLHLPPHSRQEPGAKVNDRTAKHIGEDTPLNCLPYVARYSVDGNEWQPGWLPTQADLFADDWYVEAAPVTEGHA